MAACVVYTVHIPIHICKDISIVGMFFSKKNKMSFGQIHKAADHRVFIKLLGFGK